jgi:hypothetical protein
MSYWEERYKRGGNSGAGSVGRYRRFKWLIINRYVPSISQVIDVGCGDLKFWKGSLPIDYTGIDISKTIITKNKRLYPGSTFLNYPAEILIENLKAPVVFCLDLLFHIINESAFNSILNNLCIYSTEYIFIYTWKENPLNNKITDDKYQYFRPLETNLEIFTKHGFSLLCSLSPVFDIGAMYVFKKGEKTEVLSNG